MRIVKIKNCQESGSEDYLGTTIYYGEYYQIQTERELGNFQKDSKLLAHINPDATNPVKALISDGEADLDFTNGNSWLNGTYAQEVIPRAPKNEYDLRPYGLAHKHINSSLHIFDVTLSNKDNKNIDYSNCSIVPEFYDCIYQNHSEIRDGVASITGSTITTVLGRLNSGSAKISKPVTVDYKIETVEDVSTIFLWGIFFTAENFGTDDIIRLQVCDPDGIGVYAGLYTQEQLEALNYIVKEYDECWVRQISGLIEINTPDGAPGEIINGMVLRVLYYCKDSTKTAIEAWVDYKITIK